VGVMSGWPRTYVISMIDPRGQAWTLRKTVRRVLNEAIRFRRSPNVASIRFRRNLNVIHIRSGRDERH
jgi:hypothetical protein